MHRYKLVETTVIELEDGDEPEDFEFDCDALHERTVFDRRFVLGYHGAVRKLQRRFRRQLSYSNWHHEYRLYAVYPDGFEMPLDVPDVGGRSIAPGVFGHSVQWSTDRTTPVLYG